MKAYLALGEFRGDSSFFTWIYRIAVNLSLNALRKRQVLNYLHESELLSRILPSPDDPEKDLEHSETESLLQRAVATLPEKQKAVFVMRYYMTNDVRGNRTRAEDVRRRAESELFSCTEKSAGAYAQ